MGAKHIFQGGIWITFSDADELNHSELHNGSLLHWSSIPFAFYLLFKALLIFDFFFFLLQLLEFVRMVYEQETIFSKKNIDL